MTKVFIVFQSETYEGDILIAIYATAEAADAECAALNESNTRPNYASFVVEEHEVLP